jgi:uncharacterized protein involved in propanediol utilization
MNYDDGDHPSCYDLCTKTSYLYMMMQIHISKHTFISIATIFKRFSRCGWWILRSGDVVGTIQMPSIRVADS